MVGMFEVEEEEGLEILESCCGRLKVCENPREYSWDATRNIVNDKEAGLSMTIKWEKVFTVIKAMRRKKDLAVMIFFIFSVCI